MKPTSAAHTKTVHNTLDSPPESTGGIGAIDTTNVMCFHTTISVVDVHFHSCYQIVVSTQSTFDSEIGGKKYKGLHGFIIDKYTRHSCSAPQGTFLVYYVESKSFLGRQLKSVLIDKNFLNIEAVLSRKQIAEFGERFSQDLHPAQLKIQSDILLSEIFKGLIRPVTSEVTDARILQATTYIHDHLNETITLEAVACHIHLSPDRTRHLFLEQLEVPFSQYILWKRIKAVLTAAIVDKEKLFDASLKYGFTDQSHFNRFFKRMFGISAKVILKNSRFIQFIYPEM